MTETELEQIYSRSDCRVYAFDARDKYGDYGITGLSIAELQNNEATLKVFLMSCRTIGRDFERAFFNFITSDLKSLGIKTLHCPYYRTQKNNLVENLYGTLGCNLSSESDVARNYVLDITTYSPSPLEHVSIFGGPQKEFTDNSVAES
jgi:predicted enzyme involved in methoxymalonyl-ACP biosynthesis